jgi:hypothetical protein
MVSGHAQAAIAASGNEVHATAMVPLPAGAAVVSKKTLRIFPLRDHKPTSWLTRITFTRSLGKDFSVIVQVLQIRSGLLQSVQEAVLTQGVLRPG